MITEKLDAVVEDFFQRRTLKQAEKLIPNILSLYGHREVTRDKILLLSLSGGRAYGTSRPDSDWDFIMVVEPPEHNIIGMHPLDSFHKKNDQLDLRVYSPAQFHHMITKSAVNSVETLFLPTILRSTLFNSLWNNRHLFLRGGTVASILGHTKSTLGRFTSAANTTKGSKRRFYIETYGYDISAAVHSLRWLWIGLDLASDPTTLTVKMYPQRQQFLRLIKDGKVSKEDVLAAIHKYYGSLQNVSEELMNTLNAPGDRYKQVAQDSLVYMHRHILLS